MCVNDEENFYGYAWVNLLRVSEICSSVVLSPGLFCLVISIPYIWLQQIAQHLYDFWSNYVVWKKIPVLIVSSEAILGYLHKDFAKLWEVLL